MKHRNFIKVFSERFNIDFLFVKFVLVGILNTAFGYLAYAFFVMLNFGDFAAPLLSTICGVLFNFKTIGKLVFENTSNYLIFKFLSVYLLTYCLTVSLLKLLAFAGLQNRYISGALILLPMALISFFLNKHFVFKTEK
ncbi:MAG: GtrA family protein [Elusimicrobiaceae bacterium]|nr:GtrA family protein [Elusimicrobiota bacterium]